MKIGTFGFGVVALALTVAACGSDDSGSGGSTGNGGVTFSEIGAKYTTVYCSTLTKCFGPMFDEAVTGVDCETMLGPQIEDGMLVPVEDAIDAGRVIYHGDKVEACLAAVATLGCDAMVQRGPEACEDVFEGTVEAGGDCELDAECVGKQVCKAIGSCPGTCSARQKAGEACGDDDHCEDGLVCGENSKKCETPSKKGEACGGDNPDCMAGYLCLGENEDTNQPGTCDLWDDVLKGKAGDTCNLEEGPWCESGNACSVVDIVAGSGATWECVATAASGAACNFGFPSACPAGEYCDADIGSGQYEGTCKALPSAGDPCNTVGYPNCAPYLTCDNGTCRKVERIGGSCTSNSTCASGNCKSGTCAAGDACSSWAD